MQPRVQVVPGLLVTLIVCLLSAPSTIAIPQCLGVYDASLFAKIDLVCDDCHNTFHTVEIAVKCRENCFTSKYFKSCLDLLQKDEREIEEYKAIIKQIHGAPVYDYDYLL